jgi:serine/threonine-protein kinase
MTKRKILEIDGVSYTVKSKLGQGGAAKVWKVISSADDKTYALKQIEKSEQSDRNERFRREIEFGMASRNDHVVRIHTQHEDDNYFYYTMDWYPKSLRKVIAEESDYLVLLDYLSQLCDGLAYVHGQGAVHRDIKPENILVDTESRRLVLADFGIAHFKDSSLTQKSDLLANRNYQAPEQMAKTDARGVGKPADIFALGLIITEVFTKQNSRGARHRRIGDIHPFLSNLDLLVERMMLQDETQRITVQAARDSLNLIRKQVDSRIEELVKELRQSDLPKIEKIPEADSVLERAGKDVLSAKFIFERATGEELSRYNQNYHCEISYRVSDELYNGCVQSLLYSMCKSKFEYEAKSTWSESDLKLVISPLKAQLQSEFEAIQRQYPLASNSIWVGLPLMAASYFRFCKDYHCKEILETAHRELSITPYSGTGSLHSNLVDAPIIWIASSVRWYLKNDLFEMSTRNLQRVEFERQVSVYWEKTDLNNSDRRTLGADLFDQSDETESVGPVLEELKNKWDASYAKQSDGRYSIHFRSGDEYESFRKQALSVAASDDVFEGDVLDLLRPEDEYDDLVALMWEPTFDIPNTLAKVLGLREI